MTISLVIPATPGDAIFLPELLRTINAGSILPYEVIVSVSAGNLVPSLLVKEIEDAFGDIQRGGIILNQEIMLASGNRNRAGALARGEVIAYIDADDVPHPRLLELVGFMFENFDILHLNHCISYEPLPTTPLGPVHTIGADQLYPAYFPDGDYLQCKDLAPCYGAGLLQPFGAVAAGHTYVRKEVLKEVAWREPVDRVFRKGEDYEFCMEVLYKYRKSMIIDSVLSQFRPSSLRGQGRHGYENPNYISIRDF
jgi:glycosyltransferase involved in cell wall biosynthesis